MTFLPEYRRTPLGTATEDDVAAGKTFMSAGSYRLKTGNRVNHDGSLNTPTTWGNASGDSTISVVVPAGIYPGGQGNLEIDDSDHIPGNIRAGVNDYGVTGTFTADATATAADIAAGKTAGINGQMVTGTMQPKAFAPSKQTAQVNATAFNQSGDSYVLLFNTIVPDVNDNLLGLSISFMDAGDAAWEYEDGKNFGVTAMSFSVMVVNGELAANHQTIDLGSASMSIDINNADISGGVLSFDVVFTPTAGTFVINNNTPMISVDIWSY